MAEACLPDLLMDVPEVLASSRTLSSVSNRAVSIGSRHQIKMASYCFRKCPCAETSSMEKVMMFL